MWYNQLKTVILLATLMGLLMLLGGLLGGYSGIVIAFIVALLINGITYFFSDSLVLKMFNAKPLDKDKYQWIHSTVEDLAIKNKIPMPKLWIINNQMANAFATGRNPQHASVAVTTGILNILEKDELRGVLAHELSHIKNRDILVSTIAATVATAIGFIANMMQHMAYWGSGERRRGPHPLVMLFVALLMPIAATLIQLAISRSREYLADENGAYTSHDPLSLASALEKLQTNLAYAHLKKNDFAHASTAHLFIVYPFTAKGLMALFSTHPPMHKRIERLHKIYENIIHYYKD